ncbi:hypothetical protein [Arcobacter sp. CECT 9188]|uniref:hypothetical protein n=1 Tax=Arcobacter sp. CECT 9188 TaxID=2044505 RepID=UPI000DE93E70|nr:hypothetical protein [Arcobacter sp. CECT 9188]RBQ27681.1 hypothetical protein CRU88_03150 [Arcobacter sp. CECT 9188]
MSGTTRIDKIEGYERALRIRSSDNKEKVSIFAKNGSGDYASTASSTYVTITSQIADSFGNLKMRTINSYYLLISLIGTTMIFIWAINVIGIIKISIGLIFSFYHIIVGIFIYSLLKTKPTFQANNLMLIDKKGSTLGVFIPLNIISKEDRKKINDYIKQYLHTDINKLEKTILAVSIFPYKNIKFDERIYKSKILLVPNVIVKYMSQHIHII